MTQRRTMPEGGVGEGEEKTAGKYRGRKSKGTEGGKGRCGKIGGKGVCTGMVTRMKRKWARQREKEISAGGQKNKISYMGGRKREYIREQGWERRRGKLRQSRLDEGGVRLSAPHPRGLRVV